MSTKPPSKSDCKAYRIANGKDGKAWAYNYPRTLQIFCTLEGAGVVLNFTVTKKTLKKLSELP